mmetsp:Transcript_53377/g.44784  ORF Transcript_53377/g.44784 Transcript_53377/m.44784 type:complete len:228 (-) Transcript_53377:264-947(-)
MMFVNRVRYVHLCVRRLQVRADFERCGSQRHNVLLLFLFGISDLLRLKERIHKIGKHAEVAHFRGQLFIAERSHDGAAVALCKCLEVALDLIVVRRARESVPYSGCNTSRRCLDGCDYFARKRGQLLCGVREVVAFSTRRVCRGQFFHLLPILVLMQCIPPHVTVRHKLCLGHSQRNAAPTACLRHAPHRRTHAVCWCDALPQHEAAVPARAHRQGHGRKRVHPRNG